MGHSIISIIGVGTLMEMHYYHISEVWHALYNRAEERHLRDPENLEVKEKT